MPCLVPFSVVVVIFLESLHDIFFYFTSFVTELYSHLTSFWLEEAEKDSEKNNQLRRAINGDKGRLCTRKSEMRGEEGRDKERGPVVESQPDAESHPLGDLIHDGELSGAASWKYLAGSQTRMS